MATKTVAFVCFIFELITVANGGDSINSILFNSQYEFIDLSHPFDNKTLYWPDMQRFIFTKKIASAASDDW